jgi:serine/threonine-protein kinase
MPLASGARLGAYEILSALGAGGMGEVYRARDTKLNRDVAIKVIPEMFPADADRLARFEREAQTLAALNHPNIAHVYGLERQERRDRQDGTPVSFIVMELVDGEELALRIARGPLPLDEALPIAAQIAEALEAAHEQNIIHRDLKPANIKIKPDGTVKVLDFGLAKAMDATAASSASASISPTLSVHATQAGVILGTAAYMSPEQARGRPVDKRADIWAFGVVLYEMVTGRKPFHGDDVGEVLAGVIKEQPRWDHVPAALRRLLQRCLEKDPKKRLRDISGVALLLEEPHVAAPSATRASILPWIAAGILAVVAAVALWAPWTRTTPESQPFVRLDVDLGIDSPPGLSQGAEAIVSPDGGRLVWVSRNRLFTRRLDQPRAMELASTQGAYSPFFSPDGRWVAFFASGRLRKISMEGGASIALCDENGRGGSWGGDGRIVFANAAGTLMTVPASGGTPTPLTEASQGGVQMRWPQLLPGGHAVLFTARPEVGTYDDASIDVLSLRDNRRKTLQRGATYGRFISGANGGPGHLVYASRGTLFAVPFDVEQLEVRGTPAPMLEDVAYNSTNGAAQFDASRTGTLVYRAWTGTAPVELRWLDGDGNAQALPARPGVYGHLRLSPDGALLAMSIVGAGGQDIWTYDWQRDRLSRVTTAGAHTFPVWSSNSRYIVFTSGFGGGGMWWTGADRARQTERLMEGKTAQFPWSFSPDGKRLAYAECVAGNCDLWTVPIQDDGQSINAGEAELFLKTPASEIYPTFSPDGRWIAYRTLETGTSEIQVRAFPDTGGKWLISNTGGAVPVWSPNGRELFYRTEDQRIMVVSYTVKDGVFIAEKPRVWSERRLTETPQSARNLDITPDGKRFVVTMAADAPGEQPAHYNVILLQNFSQEIARRIGAAK